MGSDGMIYQSLRNDHQDKGSKYLEYTKEILELLFKYIFNLF